MSRLICVSNRVSLPDPQTGRINAGGLAVGIRAALENRQDCIWFGWNGEIKENPHIFRWPHALKSRGINFLTVPLTRREYEGYYKKMANSTLWPLMHGLVGNVEASEEAAAIYREVNDMFAKLLRASLRPGDIIWVHDYHLIPLGRSLRALGVENKILFFSHIPMPSPATLSHPGLPSAARRQFRELASDLFYYDRVGFQSYRDYLNFTAGLNDRAPPPPRFATVRLRKGEMTEFGVFPISIETGKIAEKAAPDPQNLHGILLKETLHRSRLVIGAERLDYTKGIPERIIGMSRLYDLFPEHRKKIRYVQICPLSRSDIDKYKVIINRTRAAVSCLNERHACPGWAPIDYSEKSLPRRDLLGWLRRSRVGLITPLIDGQNLVAKEYIAAQDPADPGILVLGKNAGAAEELGEYGALLVDPRDPDSIANKVHRALLMSAEERVARHKAAFTYLAENTIEKWASRFLANLHPAYERRSLYAPNHFPKQATGIKNIPLR